MPGMQPNLQLFRQHVMVTVLRGLCQSNLPGHPPQSQPASQQPPLYPTHPRFWTKVPSQSDIECARLYMQRFVCFVLRVHTGGTLARLCPSDLPLVSSRMGTSFPEPSGKSFAPSCFCRMLTCRLAEGECLPGARPARYFSINYPDFSPRFTLSWRSPPSRPRCTAHLPYKARCIIKQYL